MPPVLIAPTTRLHLPWLQAHSEWGPGLHEDGFGLTATDEVESPEGFAAWVARLTAEPSRATCRWIVEGDRVQGAIALRHQLNPRTGHIGYGIRPSARGQGLATWALAEILREARNLDLGRVLLVCAADNPASARTIERNGGVLEDSPDSSAASRYWIDLAE